MTFIENEQREYQLGQIPERHVQEPANGRALPLGKMFSAFADQLRKRYDGYNGSGEYPHRPCMHYVLQYQ